MRIVSGREAVKRIERLAARGERLGSADLKVRRIVNQVRRKGDVALRRYAERWDGLDRDQSLRVSQSELEMAQKSLSPELRASLREAADNIRSFCELQKPRSWTQTLRGISLSQVIRPLESVGCYVPGGRYPLLSSVLMTVIPAQVAGVTNIRVVSPKPSKEILGAAAMLGIREFYRIGGAQAIAALAYGTESISRVDKIVGPGNAYVTDAKRMVAFDCAIDFLAGPTEALIVSESGRPDFIAADLVAQAEHDVDALAVFITTSQKLAGAVSESVIRLSKGNPIAQTSLRKSGAIFVATSRAQAREWANRLAPEHITVSAAPQ